MKLTFTNEGYRVLVDILLKRERVELAQNERHRTSSLLQKALARDLSLDIAELEDLEQILKESAEALARSAAQCDTQACREKALAEQSFLESMIDRVTEACAMV